MEKQTKKKNSSITGSGKTEGSAMAAGSTNCSFYERYESACYMAGFRPFGNKIQNALHVSRTTISRWKNNGVMPGADTLALIATTLHVSSDFLIGISDDREDSVAVARLYNELDPIDKARAFSYIQALVSKKTTPLQ